jgi:transcriptional regulator with XRE-family HTH domain
VKLVKFGEQIKRIRTSRNLTQEQFAGKMNITRQAVSNWENNRNLPDIEMLIHISEEFHVSLDQLILGGTDKNKMTEKLKFFPPAGPRRFGRGPFVRPAAGAGLLRGEDDPAAAGRRFQNRNIPDSIQPLTFGRKDLRIEETKNKET